MADKKDDKKDKKKDKKDKHHGDDDKNRRKEERAKRREKEDGKDKKEKEKKEKHKDKKEKSTNGAPTGSTSPPVSSALELEGVNQAPIESVYNLGKVLGQGAFSVVKEASHKITKEKYAIKVIKKTTVAGEDIKLLRREIANLKTLDHPNILKLYEVYEDKEFFYLVMELVQGKELFDKIVERGQYSERDAANITRQFVSAIEYLHSKGIAHRDLKPENLLSLGSGDKEIIKVADFGLSKNFGEEKMMTSCGSPGYVAPEVLESESYDKAVDMWSIGVILYILLVGYPPFYADTDPQLFKKIMACDYAFGEGWENISDTAKNLVKSLLVKDPKKRLTASQCLAHPWFSMNTELSSKQLQMTKLKELVTKGKNIGK